MIKATYKYTQDRLLSETSTLYLIRHASVILIAGLYL